MSAESERAGEFRRQQKARARTKRHAERSLAGSATAKAELLAKTEPLKFAPDDDGVRRADGR